jgi:hypothetical protein
VQSAQFPPGPRTTTATFAQIRDIWAAWIEGQWRQDGEDLLKENSIKLGALIGIDYRKTEQKMLAARSAGINSSRRKSCASAIRRECTSS